MTRSRVFLMPIWLTLAVGCGSCGGSQSTSESPSESASQDESSRWGIVEGVVRLAAGAELPLRPAPLEAAGRPPMPESCTPPRTLDRQPVRMGDGRGLMNVLVAAAEFDGDVEHDAAVHEVVIRDCRLEPPFLAATRGDRVEVKNETEHPFLPRLGTTAFMELVNQGDARAFELEQGGVTDINCGFSTNCGRAEIVVLYHPVHTVSTDDGRFRIENVPPDQELEIHAWHPLFEEASMTVTVAAGATERVELELTPAPPPPEPPAAPDGDEPSTTGPAEDQPGLF